MYILDAYQAQLEQVYCELICIEVLGGLSDQATVGIDSGKHYNRCETCLKVLNITTWATRHL